MKALGLAAACVALSGCALFNPYDSEFMCQATDDYGRCMSVDGAYTDAVAGRKNPPRSKGKKSVDDTEHAASDAAQRQAEAASYSAYKQSEYREMRALLDQPVTPLVKPPKVLRTLITAYPSNAKTLYTPRYVFFFADEGRFVLGDYLNAAVPDEQPSAGVGPFGAQ